MKLYSVNELLENKEEFNGQRVYVEGLFEYGAKCISVCQWPKSEQVGGGIWVSKGNGAFGYNKDSLIKLSNKKVVCLGEFQADGDISSFDDFYSWFPGVVATELVYYKKWHEANG